MCPNKSTGTPVQQRCPFGGKLVHSTLEIQSRKFSRQQNVRPGAEIRPVMMPNCGQLTPRYLLAGQAWHDFLPDTLPPDRTPTSSPTRTRPLTDGHSDHYVPPRVVMKDRMIAARHARSQHMPGTNAASVLRATLEFPELTWP